MDSRGLETPRLLSALESTFKSCSPLMGKRIRKEEKREWTKRKWNRDRATERGKKSEGLREKQIQIDSLKNIIHIYSSS